MEWLAFVVAALFLLMGSVSVIAVAVGLPGTWIMIAVALVIEWADRFYLPVGNQQTFDWWLLIVCLLLAAFGELLEFLAGAIGAQKAGSSKRGITGALVGGLLGAIAGIWIPIPIIGSLIGSFLGTFVGALLGELSALEASSSKKQTIKPAIGATIGKILGTVAKLPIAMAVWIGLTISAFLV